MRQVLGLNYPSKVGDDSTSIGMLCVFFSVDSVFCFSDKKMLLMDIK
jgi:hypothetical protein